jgi:hypothetical protein
MNPLAALELLAAEATSIFESVVTGGGALYADGVGALGDTFSVAHRSVLPGEPVSEAPLAAFRESDGSDWIEGTDE